MPAARLLGQPPRVRPQRVVLGRERGGRHAQPRGLPQRLLPCAVGTQGAHRRRRGQGFGRSL